MGERGREERLGRERDKSRGVGGGWGQREEQGERGEAVHPGSGGMGGGKGPISPHQPSAPSKVEAQNPPESRGILVS